MVNRRAYSLPMHVFVINFVIDIIINLNSPSKHRRPILNSRIANLRV
jgi:hypothetical protein